MFYRCEFPFCEYFTTSRNKIHFHHIIPKELNGNNSKNNIIHLCPNCHAKIFIENSKSGTHSIKTENSIIILNRIKSTAGCVLKFKKMNELTYLYFYGLKEEISID